MPRLYSDESIISPFTMQIWILCMVPKVSAVPKQRSGCANTPGARYLAHTVAEGIRFASALSIQ